MSLSVPSTLAPEPLDLCDQLQSRCRSAGASEVEAYYSDQRTSSMDMVDGALESVVYAGERGVGLRVIVDGALGYAFTSDFSPDGLAELVARSVSLAREAGQDPHRALAQPEPVLPRQLEIFDSSLRDLSDDAKLDLLRGLDQAARDADSRVESIHLARYSDEIGSTAIVTSRGVSASFASTSCYASVTVVARQDGGANRGSAVTAGRKLADLDVGDAGRRSAWRATAPLGGRAVPTRQATLVLDPSVAAEILRSVALALSGDAILKGRSFLLGHENRRVGSNLLTLTDEGALPGGYSTAPVDGEGVPSRTTPLFDRGVLVGALHTVYSANRASARSTGNGVRASYRYPPEVSHTNLRLEPGVESVDDLVRGVDTGLLVVSTRNVGGINPVSGDYSVGASGRWIERGELAGPVAGVTLAAPLMDLLANISAVANDVRWIPGTGSISTPTIRIDGVMVGGR